MVSGDSAYVKSPPPGKVAVLLLKFATLGVASRVSGPHGGEHCPIRETEDLHVAIPGQDPLALPAGGCLAPSRSQMQEIIFQPIGENARMSSKNAFMDCFVCKCLLSDTPQGCTGQVVNVHHQAWEFPSTGAVLPCFVIPQRTS